MRDSSIGRVIKAGFWGAVAGGTAGFALGLLLAPEDGRVLRRRIVYRLEHWAGEVSDLVNDITSGEVTSDAQRTGQAIVADAEARADRIRRDIDDLLDEMRRKGDAGPATH